MKECFDDFPLQLRHCHPKRVNRKKLFRSRLIYKGNPVILKAVFVQGPKEIEKEGKEFVSDDEHERIVSILNRDPTELNCQVVYSQGKKKRWLIPDQLQKNLPSFELYGLPYPLETVSFNRMFRHRAEVYSPFLTFFSRYYDLRRIKGETRLISVRRKDGTSVSHSGPIPSFLPYVRNSESDDVMLHVQYQSVEFENVFGLMNSHVFESDSDLCLRHECSCCHGYRAGKKPPGSAEYLRLGKELPRSGYLTWQFEDEEFENLEEETGENEEKMERKTWTLGDFMREIQKKQKKKKTGKNEDLDEWVIV